jgi:hypothetical protein
MNLQNTEVVIVITPTDDAERSTDLVNLVDSATFPLARSTSYALQLDRIVLVKGRRGK